MPFLGCDVDTLRAWSVAARRDARTLGERLAGLRSAVTSVDWVGPDRDAFDAVFSSRVESACGTAAARLMEISTEAAQEADQQDRASGTGADGSGGRGAQGGGDGNSPGETDQSGPPVPVPDDVRQQIDDPTVIVQKAIDIK